MSRRPFLLKLLNVRPSEWKVVSQLFWLQFFMGTGVAFFFTASFTHFLEKFSASQLAWVMIISSPLLFITGWVFNKFEHRFHLTSVGTVVIILMAASIFILQISSNWIKEDWFDYLMFAWYYVLYLASNLCFWSITSTLFDVRQSKRLFAVISGGDIPAKLIGYTIAYFFVKAIGPLNMLWPAFIFILGALPFLYQLSKSGVVHHHHDHHPDHSIEFIQGKGFKNFVKRYTLNVLIRRIAVLTFIISSCLAIVNYAFYFEIKEVHHDDKSLSSFIILFMAASQIIALLVKIIFTGRIVTSIGIKKSLLITPLVLLALLIVIISAQYAVGYEKLVFYTFGMAAVAVEVLRIAITNPVFLTVMQPLNPNARSKAHAIVKGIMDPFAFLFAGILLLLINMKIGTELLTICYILAFLAISWVISVFLVNNSYHNTLLKTISSRFFSQDEFKLSDDEIQHQILKKIKTGKETEIINILQMLNSQISTVSKEIIFKLLDHPSYNIKKVTLILIQNRNIKGAEEKLKYLADHDENKEIQYLAAQSLCKEQNEHHQKHYLHHHDPKIKIAAISGMLKSVAKENREHAQAMIHDLIRSEKIKDKQMALQILTEVKDDFSHPDHADLFTVNREVRIAAFKAIGPSATARLLENVMTYFKEHSLHVASVLHAAGEKSIPIILENLSDNINPSLKEKLIIVIGKIGGAKAHETLLYLLEKHPTDSGAIAKALHRSRYKATQETQKKLEEVSFAYINYGIELLSMQNLLDSYKEKYAVINSSLNIELAEIRNILICLFGCLYDHEKAFKIKQGLEMKKKENVANAMELIEMTVKKELAMPFNLLYEPADIEHRYNSLKKFLSQDNILQAEDILSKILTEKPIFYNSWTKASAMYISKKTSTLIKTGLIEKFTHSENLLLKETALYAQ